MKSNMEIPDEIGWLGGLEGLYLDGNRFTGLVPRTITQHKSLRYLDLSFNLLYGTISDFDGIQNLEKLWINNNNFVGNLPSFSSALNTIDVSSNLICGPIPQSLVNDTSSKFCNFENTNVCLSVNDIQIVPNTSCLPNITTLRHCEANDSTLCSENFPLTLISSPIYTTTQINLTQPTDQVSGTNLPTLLMQVIAISFGVVSITLLISISMCCVLKLKRSPQCLGLSESQPVNQIPESTLRVSNVVDRFGSEILQMESLDSLRTSAVVNGHHGSASDEDTMIAVSQILRQDEILVGLQNVCKESDGITVNVGLDN
ncbi:hypothetical protein HK096_009497 [Nowakowskiella sp. JEL0078]|nr:hypothetical protein HK096_009497 [Nowakowskiella sp. JEL0078]